MEEFGTDLLDHLKGYYNSLIDITPKLGLAIAAFLIAWFIASKAKNFANRKLKKKMHDPLLATFISRLIKMALLVVGLLLVLRIVGLTEIAGSLLAGAGISAFVIGFALKDIGENFLAGILLAFKRPFNIGDIIESEDIKGTVVALNMRDTQIASSGKNIYIPNAMLINNPLTNFTRSGLLSQDLMLRIEYGADYERALKIISDTINAVECVLDDDQHKSYVMVTGVSLNSVEIEAGYYIKTNTGVSSGETKSEVIIAILKALNDEGFNIPANVVEIKKYETDVYKNGERIKLDGKKAISGE